CQRVKGWMDSQGRRHQIDQWRLVADLSIAEKFGARDMAAAPVGLNALPIVDSLQDMLARFCHLQLDNNQSPILPECQQIDGPHAKQAASSSPELGVQRRNYQAGIEASDVATQQ